MFRLKKVYSLYLLLILFYMFSFSLGEQRLSLYSNYAYLIGLFVSTAFLVLAIKNQYIVISPIYGFTFLLIQILTLSFGLLSGKLLVSLVNAGHQILFFILFAGLIKTYKLDYVSGAKYIGDFIIITSTISLVFAFYGFLVGNFSYGPFKYEVVLRHAFRLKGWYQSANYLGPVLGIGGISILYRILNSKFENITKQRYIIYAFLLLGHIAGLILTGSKGSILAFLGGLIVLSFTFFEFNTLMFKKIVIGLIFLLISYFSTVYTLNKLGFDSLLIQEELIRLDSIEGNLEGGDRVGYYLTAIEMLKTATFGNLLFGHGIGYFTEITGSSPHSGYIEVIVGRGLVISILLSLLLVILLIKSFSLIKVRNVGALFLSILVLIVLKNFTNVDFPSNNFPGVILIFITALFSIKNSEHRLC